MSRPEKTKSAAKRTNPGAAPAAPSPSVAPSARTARSASPDANFATLEQLLNGWPIVRRVSFTLARFLTRLLYRVTYEGCENIPTAGPMIVVANHTSLIDISGIQSCFKPWVHWVAKKQLFTKPVIGGFFRRMGCVPVDRDKVDLQAARGIIGTLHAGHIIGMFPQATRVPDAQINEVLPRTGIAHFAIKTGVPLLPVVIDGQFRLFRRVRIVFGQPFQLETQPQQRFGHPELMAFTIRIMQHVYGLVGRPYEPSSRALAADNLIRRPDGSLAAMTDSEKFAAQLIGQAGSLFSALPPAGSPAAGSPAAGSPAAGRSTPDPDGKARP